MPNNNKHSEDELVLLLKQKEESAYSYLYDHYSSTLYGVILQIISREEIAKDVLQLVFTKIYQKIELYDESKGRLYTWMFQIARNAALDKVRTRAYKEERKNYSLSNAVNDNNTPSCDFPFMDHLGIEKVLKELDVSHRSIIDLAYFKGYTQKEIAKELDLPLGTVKTRARNALKQLRKALT